MTTNDDFYNSLKFAHSGTREKESKDELKPMRKKLMTGLEGQKLIAKEIQKDPEKERPNREIRFFRESGKEWRFQLRYGRRVLNLTEDPKQDDLIAGDIAGVISIIDGLIRMINSKDKRIDAALLKMKRTKSSSSSSAPPAAPSPEPPPKPASEVSKPAKRTHS